MLLLLSTRGGAPEGCGQLLPEATQGALWCLCVFAGQLSGRKKQGKDAMRATEQPVMRQLPAVSCCNCTAEIMKLCWCMHACCFMLYTA